MWLYPVEGIANNNQQLFAKSVPPLRTTAKSISAKICWNIWKTIQLFPYFT